MLRGLDFFLVLGDFGLGFEESGERVLHCVAFWNSITQHSGRRFWGFFWEYSFIHGSLFCFLHLKSHHLK
jgi:hypothetical protein